MTIKLVAKPSTQVSEQPVMSENQLYKEWRLPSNKHLHREGAPAREWHDGDKSWYQHDQLHRENGPAIEHYRENSIKWYWHNELIPVTSQEEFERWKRLRAFL
jgi:hypothetical protein